MTVHEAVAVAGRGSDEITLSRELAPVTVPTWIVFHPDLEALDVRLYAALSHHAESGALPPRLELATSLCLLSRRSVDVSLERLQAAGALTISERHYRGGRRGPDLVELHLVDPRQHARGKS